MADADAEAAGRARGVTGRAIVLALALLVAIVPLNFYIEVVWGADWEGIWNFATGMPAVVPVVSLMLLALLLSLPLLRRLAFSRRELLTVYAIILIGSPVMSHAVLCWMLVKNVAYYYASGGQPSWGPLFLRYMPTWYSPSDPVSVNTFFEGQARVPWAAWSTPLLAWGGFLVALIVASVSVMALVQRQWVTHERLTFPLAQIPLSMIETAGPDGADGPGRLSGSWSLWIGIMIAFAANFISTLSKKMPTVPDLPISLYDIVPAQYVGPLAGLGGLTILLWPWMIAIAYLIPRELAFSVWFFTLVRHVLTMVAIALGGPPTRPEDWWSASFPAPYYQGGGAVLALSVWVLWAARRHLGLALRGMFGRRVREDYDEPMRYRTAAAGVILGVAFMVGFLWVAGCRVLFGLAVVGMTLGYFTIWARLRAETGLSFLAFPIQIPDIAMVPLGSMAFRVRELITLITMRWAYTPGFGVSSEIFPGSALEAFKIADAARLNARRLVWAMGAAVLVALVAGSYVFLRGTYAYGWFGMAASRSGWLGPQSMWDGARIVSFLTEGSLMKPNINGMVALATGAALVLWLCVMRLRFYWWPFHPIGYIASNTWGSHWWFVPFFVGWSAKSLVTRYGGLRLFRATVPLAVGLIVGDLMNGALWATIKVATHGKL